MKGMLNFEGALAGLDMIEHGKFKTEDNAELLDVITRGHPGGYTSIAAMDVAETFERLRNAEVIAAHVTVSDETLIVEPTEIGNAIQTLGGNPVNGKRLDVSIEFKTMSLADFSALPEWQ